MSAPTIDEMLEWIDAGPERWSRGYGIATAEAIRAILQEYNKDRVSLITEEEVRLYQLEAIRAFVVRVEKHWPYADHNVMRQELAAIEKEEARYDGNAI
jgi:hypothetical protein